VSLRWKASCKKRLATLERGVGRHAYLRLYIASTTSRVIKVRAIFDTENGERIIVHSETDELLYSGHWIGGREENRWDDLYVHKTKKGKNAFYIAHHTQWQGEEPCCTLVGGDELNSFIAKIYHRLTTEEIKRFEELGIKFEETA
jgi:hypothetical protein